MECLKVATHYARCVICMRDARDSQIKGHIANHQQTRVYTLFAIRSFKVNKFIVHFQKSVNTNFFFGNEQSYRLEERSLASQITQPLYTMHGLLIFDVFAQARMGHKEHRNFSRCAGHFGACVKKLIYTHNIR